MWALIRQHPTAVLVALLIHLLLLAFFVVNFDWHRPTGGLPQPIEAVAVTDPSQVQALRQQMAHPPPPQPPEPQTAPPEPPSPPAPEPRQEELARQQAAERQRQAEEERRKKLEAEQRRKAEEERRKKLEAEQRRKAEEERRKKLEAEQRRKAEEERRKKLEAEKRRKAEAERKRREAARRKRLAEERRRRAAEQKAEQERLAQMMASEEAALAAAALQRERNRYIAAIKRRVQSNWLRPPDTPTGNCRVLVTQAPNGTILDVKVEPSPSCNPAMRQSVEKAVWRSDPLPRPPSRQVYERQIRFVFEPQP